MHIVIADIFGWEYALGFRYGRAAHGCRAIQRVNSYLCLEVNCLDELRQADSALSSRSVCCSFGPPAGPPSVGAINRRV